MISLVAGMHMLPGENVEKLEGAPNFRQVEKLSETELPQLLGCWFPHIWRWSAHRGGFLQSPGEDKSSDDASWKP